MSSLPLGRPPVAWREAHVRRGLVHEHQPTGVDAAQAIPPSPSGPLVPLGGRQRPFFRVHPSFRRIARLMVAVCQARSDARGGAYYRKKIDEGKTRKEALRCLKQRLGCRLQESSGGFTGSLARRRVTKRSLERRLWAKFTDGDAQEAAEAPEGWLLTPSQPFRISRRTEPGVARSLRPPRIRAPAPTRGRPTPRRRTGARRRPRRVRW